MIMADCGNEPVEWNGIPPFPGENFTCIFTCISKNGALENATPFKHSIFLVSIKCQVCMQYTIFSHVFLLFVAHFMGISGYPASLNGTSNPLRKWAHQFSWSSFSSSFKWMDVWSFPTVQPHLHLKIGNHHHPTWKTSMDSNGMMDQIHSLKITMEIH